MVPLEEHGEIVHRIFVLLLLSEFILFQIKSKRNARSVLFDVLLRQAFHGKMVKLEEMITLSHIKFVHVRYYQYILEIVYKMNLYRFVNDLNIQNIYKNIF